MRADIAAWILSLVSTPDRAKELAAELAAATASRAPIVFWLSLARTGLSLVSAQVRAAPLRLAALVVAGYIATYLLGEAFLVGPRWLIRHPYNSSLLSSFWIREAARAMLREERILRYLAVPFLVGLFVAWLSRGRELAACLVMLLWDLAAGTAERVWIGHLGLFRIGVLLAYTLRGYLFVLAGAIVARMWFLRNWRRAR